MSAHRAFHWAYGGEVTAAKIAHFLILNPQCPRALITCVDGLNAHLDRLTKAYRRTSTAQGQARLALAGLAEARVDEIFEEGLHEFLTRFITDMAGVGLAIHETYLSGDAR